jgi:hypothetical protein
MHTDTVLAVEGPSDLAVISALISCMEIDQLSVLRTGYSRKHAVLAKNAARGTRIVVVLDGLHEYGETAWRPPLDWPKDYSTANVLPSWLLRPPVTRSSEPRLPTWCTSDFAGMPAGTWPHEDTQTEPTATPARTAPPRVLYCLPISAGSTIIDSWASIVRVLDRVLAAMHLMRLRVRTGVERTLDIRTFVLVMLAACRHYGQRSEPDDHASLVIRRHLVSMGSCPQT